jgi:hypothetical protein
MHELTIFAALGDREPCVRTSDVSNDASAQSIPSFSPSVNDLLRGPQEFVSHSGAVGVCAAAGVTITVAVMPAVSVIVGGTLSILIRTGIRWASRTHV